MLPSHLAAAEVWLWSTWYVPSVPRCPRSIKAVDMGSGKSRKWRAGAHDAGVSCLLPLAPGRVASGDDDGCVKLWDARQPEATAQLRQHTDYVADFAHQVPPATAPAASR